MTTEREEFEKALDLYYGKNDFRDEPSEYINLTYWAWQARGELDAVRIKEWQSLSDDEIGRLAVFDGLHHVEIPLLAKFILAIDKALREKNG